MILVTGATGNVGRNVVAQLRSSGEDVRVLTRSPGAVNFPDGVDVVGGALDDTRALARALDGVEKAYLFPVPDAAAGFVSAAKAAGLRRIVVLSSSATTLPGNPIGEYHLTVERAVENGFDGEWTHVRPGAFAYNTVRLWGKTIRQESVVRSPYGDAQIAPMHEADIAAVAVTALLDDGHAGAKYVLTGPESLSQRDQVEIIGKAAGRAIRFEELTEEQAERDGVPTMPLDYLRSAVGVPAKVLPTIAEVTARPARTFAEWAEDHAEDFR